MHNTPYTIYYSGKYLRGFHRHLLKDPPSQLEYRTANGKNGTPLFFETKPWYVKLPLKLWHSALGDMLGLIFRQNLEQVDYADAIQTYNRFARTGETPYVILLENPTALYHYDLRRPHTVLGQRRMRTLLQDPNLQAIACMSRACHSTLDPLLPGIGPHTRRDQIYPYLPPNPLVDEEVISNRREFSTVRALTVTSEFMFKGGPEIIRAFEQLARLPVKLTLITREETIPADWKKRIGALSNVEYHPFDFGPEEMQRIYAEHHFLLHPTLKDSFALVVLEAMKSGLPVIATSLYAIPEMVDETNGQLTKPPLHYFDSRNLPNPDIWKQDRKLNDRPAFELLSDFIVEAVKTWVDDPALLIRQSLASWRKANEAPFSRACIHEQWNRLYASIIEGRNEGLSL